MTWRPTWSEDTLAKQIDSRRQADSANDIMSEKEIKEKLERLKASRGAPRGVITRSIGDANDILEQKVRSITNKLNS